MNNRSKTVQSNEPSEWAGLVGLFALVRTFPMRILAITTLTAVFGFVIAASQESKHESSIVLGLENWQNHNPVVDGLGIPVGTEDTRDAYSILRSQEVLSLVVSGKSQGLEDFRMGLTTWIEEYHGLDLFGTSEDAGSVVLRGSLVASIGTKLTLTFMDESHVQVMECSSALGSVFARINPYGEAKTIEFETGKVFQYGDHELNLTASGSLAGRTFIVQRLTERQAIDRLRSSISVQIPTDRNGVVRATVQSSQRNLAKQLATAISAAFLHHEHSKLNSQAKGVVEYLGGEITLRQSELSRLDALIAGAQNSNPDLIQSEVVLERLRNSLGELRHQHDQEFLREAELANVLANSSLGDESLITLRRVALDPQVDRWLDRIDELQNLEQGSQAPEPSPLLQNQTERLHSTGLLVRSSKRYSELFDLRLAAFLEEQPNSLAALLDDNGQDLVQSKPMIDLAVQPYREAQTRLARSTEIYTDKHPDVIAGRADLEEKRKRLEAALHAHASTLQENHERAANAMEVLQRQVSRAPASTQEQWATGQTALWTKVRTALTAQHDHLHGLSVGRATKIASLAQRIRQIPFDQSTIAPPLVKRQALGTKIAQLHAKKEDAEVALAGLLPSAHVLEPANKPKLRQPHLDRLGTIIGTLVGLLLSLLTAQFSAQRRLRFESGDLGLSAQLPHVDLPVLSRMIRACTDDNFGATHPMRPNVNGPAFAALRRLRVQLNLLAERKQNTSLLGITSLVAELNEFGAEEEPTQCHQANDPREGSSSHMPSLVTSTIGALGISHALAHKNVLLVDANVFGNSLTAHLDLMGNCGLSDCLAGEVQWQTSVVTIGPNDVDVLPLGLSVGEGDEMLTHPGLGPLLEEIHHRYDVVLVQLPGVDEAPNLPSLAHKLGSTLVVENARTPLDAVECARLLGPLRRSGTRLIGTFVALRGVLVAATRAA